MKNPTPTKHIFLLLMLTALNILLRFQAINREIGNDSFFIHTMVNSLNEYGVARWILHPLSFIGLYPGSYTSSLQFLLSGMHQLTNIEMNNIIFLYCMIVGIFSILTSYVMAHELYNDFVFKFFVCFAFSTSPAVLGYTTWTIPTRGLLIILAPLLVYLTLKALTNYKFIPFMAIISLFLLTTHHLFYFLLPSLIVFIILKFHIIFRDYKVNLNKYESFAPPIILVAFILMYSIPFFTGKFIEHSRYASIDISYIRYVGFLMIPSIGGLFYLIFKPNKKTEEFFLLGVLILLTLFVYQQTYMKWFIPTFTCLLAGIGLSNIAKKFPHKVYCIVVLLLVSSVIFSGYFQFINEYRENNLNKRVVEKDTYTASLWMRNYMDTGTSISNDILFGERVFSVSEKSHFFTDRDELNLIYNYTSINISDYTRYPLASEEFWFTGYDGTPLGEREWENIHRSNENIPYYKKYNITHVVENKNANDYIIWNHGTFKSGLLVINNQRNLLYDSNKVSIWEIEK